MSLYNIIEVFPKIELKRSNGQLVKDQKKTISMLGMKFDYTGEVDQNGKACGKGVAFGLYTFSGIFNNDCIIVGKSI